jgi:hypothetical protein
MNIYRLFVYIIKNNMINLKRTNASFFLNIFNESETFELISRCRNYVPFYQLSTKFFLKTFDDD